jgi:hypothetical protein
LAGSPLWNLEQDQRNAALHEQLRDLPLDQVLANAQRVHQELVEALRDLPAEHYFNPARFRDMPADWLPWQVFAGNTYEHYRDHDVDVRTWLDGQVTV